MGMTAKLAILAGGGAFPALIARHAHESGRQLHIVAIEGEAENAVEAYPHDWVKWGEIGKILNILKRQDCRELVIIGSVSRPDLSHVRLDFGAIWNLPFILSLTVGGDDSVLSRVVRFFEEKGVTVRGAHEVAPDLTVPRKVLSSRTPSKEHDGDIAIGFDLMQALGPFDVGQAAVVSRGHVIAVEGAEGTDAMLERCAGLRQWGRKRRTGILVKCPKPGQELRVDMPAIGVRTLEKAHDAGLAGIALRAGQVLLAGERGELGRRADELGLFLAGVGAR